MVPSIIHLFVGRGGALVEAMAFNQRVKSSQSQKSFNRSRDKNSADTT